MGCTYSLFYILFNFSISYLLVRLCYISHPIVDFTPQFVHPRRSLSSNAKKSSNTEQIVMFKPYVYHHHHRKYYYITLQTHIYIVFYIQKQISYLYLSMCMYMCVTSLFWILDYIIYRFWHLLMVYVSVVSLQFTCNIKYIRKFQKPRG